MLEWVQDQFLRKGRTQTEAAAALGLTQNALSMYCSYKRFPRPEEQQRLQGLCSGLSLEKWRDEFIKRQSGKGAAA